ncbi:MULTISPECIES: hypothetical protein [Sphingosinicellaceae]|uniref:hypothetical protein n=1 Tax=Sphingosinicellaceae TaxID=2820280 RepID=UPI001C78C0CF|nr:MULTISPECIES: hypothetical protein [Polymorphobacter]QYE33040.1 hypothetical protein KZX46_02610 [Polymorphobacter sp. PAMC 29334]UAJ12284.1 hypothetical protein KTC28_20895 [Polymorphobacter megasporae]
MTINDQRDAHNRNATMSDRRDKAGGSPRRSGDRARLAAGMGGATRSYQAA